MDWFSRRQPEKPLNALSTAVDSLRTDLFALRSLVLDQDTEIKRLQNERTLRETELADLRTRHEVLIKRIGVRLQRAAEQANELPDVAEIRNSRRFR